MSPSPPRQVRKRDGRLVPFERSKIADAIFRAAAAVGGDDRFLAEQLAGVVETHLARHGPGVPGIEDVQDAVEKVLIETGHARTAKAYILYRERRAQARTRQEPAGEAAAVPLVGGSHGREPAPWSKAEVAAALVREDGLSPPEAQEVARAVEDRLLASGAPRVGEGLVAALVRAEMFARGRDSKVGRVSRVAVPRAAVREALEAGPAGRRNGSPAEMAQGLGEALLAEHLLSEVLPRATSEAHRLGRLHLFDLGAPLSLTALTLPVPRLLARHLWGEGATRAQGARRAAAALRRAVSVTAPFAARCLALEDVNVMLAPYVGQLSDEALADELRELLLAPELAAFPGRGGLLELELGLSAEVPLRLRRLAPPPPAPPGVSYGDLADASLRVARQLVREHLALRREGRAAGPRLTLVVPRGGVREPLLRALVREALAAAAEVGDPVLVFEHPGSPSRGCRWLRLEESESPDPLRFEDGDVSVASAAAVNLVAAVESSGGSMRAVLAALDPLVAAAVAAAAQRRALLVGPAAEPGGALWPLARGEHPLVDVEGAWHLLEPVGADEAVRRLDPQAAPEERAALRRQLLEHVQRVALEEAARHGLALALAETPTAEAALRMAALDAARDAARPTGRRGEARGGEAPEEAPSYRPSPRGQAGVRREPAWAPLHLGRPWTQRVRHRVDGERLPALTELLASFEAAERDVAVVEYAVDPWPRRRLRRPEAGA